VSKKKIPKFDRATKIKTVKRMLRGENISALTRELKTGRSVLYRWMVGAPGSRVTRTGAA
jgi:transposase-like protein